MVDQSRRTFLGTLGATMGGTLAVKEGVTRVRSTLSARSQRGPSSGDVVESLRVESPARTVATRRVTPHSRLNSVEDWESKGGELSSYRGREVGDFEAMEFTPVSNGRIECAFRPSFDYTRRDLSVWVYFPESPPSEIRFRLFAPDAENQIVTTEYPISALTGSWIGVEISPTRELGTPDPTRVTRIQIEVPDDGTPVLFSRFATKPSATTGRAMVIFDDNRASVATAYEEMHRRGMPGAVAVIPDAVGAEGHLDEEQLSNYHSTGWDLVSHPQLPDPLPEYSLERQRREIVRTKRWLVENGYESGADHFVAPYGVIDAKTLELLEEFHLTNYLPTAGLSGTPPTDPLTINRVPLDDVRAATRQIRLAERYNRLVVFSGHTVGNPTDQWISRSDFLEVIDQLDRSDVDVVTPTEYWSATTEM